MVSASTRPKRPTKPLQGPRAPRATRGWSTRTGLEAGSLDLQCRPDCTLGSGGEVAERGRAERSRRLPAGSSQSSARPWLPELPASWGAEACRLDRCLAA